MKPITGWEETETLYRISITCRESRENEIRALLIHGNTSRTLYLNHLDSGDVAGDKAEVIAEYCSVGKNPRPVLEGMVREALKIPEVVSAGWEVV